MMKFLSFMTCLVGVLSNEFFEWFRSRGGFIHHALEVSTGPDPSWQVRGIFATEAIGDEEKLIDVPSELQICGDHCSIVLTFMAEYELGEKSEWWPYLQVLKEHDLSIIPVFWEEHEKRWLEGAGDIPTWHLQPQADFCGFELTPELKHILGLINARSADVEGQICMVPVYDMFNHRNGQWWNSVPHVDSDMGLSLISYGTIEPGHQVFNSFGHSTPTMFWQYGFIEQQAQTWVFTIDDEVYEFALEDDEVFFGQYIARGFLEGNATAIEDIPRFKASAQRYLNQIIETTPPASSRPTQSEVSQKRFDLALAYRQAWIHALERVISSSPHHEL